MKLLECVNAYLALETLMKKETDFASAYALAGLKRRLEPHADFYAKKEMELVRAFSRKDDKGEPVFVRPGEVTFESEESGKEFHRRREELAGVEVDEVFPTAEVQGPDRIAPEVIFALEGLVTFRKERTGT